MEENVSKDVNVEEKNGTEEVKKETEKASKKAEKEKVKIEPEVKKVEKVREVEDTVVDMVTVEADGKIYEVPTSLKPISTWGYFGYEVLFAIPFIGLIFAIIFALGATNNISLRNLARSRFCILMVLLVFLGILFLLGGAITVLDYLSQIR